ncbi:MAG: carboxyl transferase [Clostridiales bacterium]|nr:carboxyl transferase [Clostridiales bacterium]
MAEYNALERVEKLLDAGSFVEVGALVTARLTDFSIGHHFEPSDGVITGYGQIDGNPVYVYSQNRAVLNGTMGEMHAKKLADLYDKAARTGTPVIGLIDCAGFRLQESVDALDAYAKVLAKQMQYARKMLMVSGIFGLCGGAMTLIPAFSDFTFMTKEARMFVNAPHTVTDDAQLSRNFNSGIYHNEVSGLAEVLETEDDVIAKIRAVICMGGSCSYGSCDEAELNRFISDDVIKDIPDTRALLNECSDYGNFLEIRPAYQPEMVTGLLRLNGIEVGAIGNVPTISRGLTTGGCRKAADFVRFCRRARIPVLTISATDGSEAVERTERSIPWAMASLMEELAGITEARVNLIIGDTYGIGYIAMTTKALFEGSNMTIAWKDVKLGMMHAEKAINIIAAQDPEMVRQAASYESRQNSIRSAAARGSVDSLIDPRETRKHLIMAFSML